MSAGVFEDLEAAGYQVSSVAELRNSGFRYREAVPVLLRWLPRVATESEREEIVRALSVPWAQEALGPLIAQFSAEPVPASPQGELVRWAVGNALEVLWDDRHFDELATLARDARLGTARQMLVLGLGKSKRREAVDVLVGLLDDPDVDGHAVKALGKLRAPASRSALLGKVNDKRAWVRKEAQRALAALG